MWLKIQILYQEYMILKEVARQNRPLNGTPDTQVSLNEYSS